MGEEILKKLGMVSIGFILFSMLFFGSKPIQTNAATMNRLEITYINPLYKDVVEESDLKKPESDDDQYGRQTLSEPAYETDINKISAQVRTAMRAREESITIYYHANGSFSKETAEAMFSTIFNQVVDNVKAETDNPSEGDYICWSYQGIHCNGGYYVYNNYVNYEMTFTMTYYTNASQETYVTTQVEDILKGFGFADSTTEYIKIKTIYDYIINHVTYDYTNLDNDDYNLKYTAYAALHDGTAVCQGYATLLYRMLRESNINCRVITGTGAGGPHAWNMIGIQDKYYLADSTWDAPGRTHTWFLKSESDFSDHTAASEYLTNAFKTMYPISTVDYKETTETEHIVQIDAAVAPTCTKTGLTAGSHCSRCGDYIVKQQVIPALGHRWDGGMVVKAATYTQAGSKIYTCTVCHATKTASIAKLPLPAVNTKITNGQLIYKVTKRGQTVTCVGITNKKIKKTTIPSTIVSQGITYKVTAIAGKAFYNCKNLKTIVIKSKDIKSIGKNAFKKIYKKATIKVPKAKLKAYQKLLKKSGIAKSLKVKK